MNDIQTMQDDAKLIERLQASVAELTGRGSVLPPRIQEAVNAMEYAADRLSTLSRDREDIRREAFEEAAKVAEYFYDNSLKLMPSLQVKIATAIRALKETPDD